MAARPRELSYIVVGVFVGTMSVEINMERIKARVLKGGHDIPEQDQRRRYPRTLLNMGKLLLLCDHVVVFDNSTAQGHRLVGFGHTHTIRWIDPVPAWAEELRASGSATER
jgi:predicted ABC-type ATPase